MRFVLIPAFLISGLAFAQSTATTSTEGVVNLLTLLGIDLVSLGASSLVFAKAIQYATEGIKGWWAGVPKMVLMVLPFVFGVGGAYLLSRTVGITDPSFAGGGWLAFGVVSALLASGWYETQKKTALRAAGTKTK